MSQEMNKGQKENYEAPHESKINSSTGIIKQSGLENENPSSNVRQQAQQKQKEGICGFMMDFMHLYKFGEAGDKLLKVFGVLIGLASGVTFPLFTYFWGKEVDHININYANLSESLDTSLYYYIAIVITGVAAFLIDGIAFGIWKLLSVRIARKFRVKYLTAFSKKSIKWIENENLYEFCSKFKTNCLTIQRAIGDKVALFYNLQGIMLSGSIAALCVRWTFTLYLFALLPIVLGVLGSFLYVIIKKKMLEKEFYKNAEAQTIQVMSLIKTVKMLGKQEQESAKFNRKLEEYADKLKGEPLRVGLTTGLFYFIQYLMYGIGFMYAIQCVRGTSACPVSVTGSHYTMGETLTVFFELFLCSYNFLQLAANFESIKGGIECSKEIFKFVDEAEQQDQKRQQQHKKQLAVEMRGIKEFGNIEFKDVSFCYPLNQEKTIFRGLNMQFLKNKFNAIAGPTGSGKSTIIQLLLKYYSPTSGQVLIDGEDIRQLDEELLRNKVGYVGQEPTLFSGTIRDNIKVGRQDATDEQILQILKKVNIYDFVAEQGKGLDFDIGVGGSRLSGGQRQRLAVARALIKDPSVLILDEATSALDRKSEMIIQETIQSILDNDTHITIICIAHRIKTISAADKIWYIEDGKVKGEGKIGDIEQLKYKMESQQQQQQQVDQDLQNPENLKTTPVLVSNLSSLRQISKAEPTDDGQNINIYSRLFQFISVKKWYYIGIVASIFNGLNHPAGAVILSYMYDSLVREVNYGLRYGWCENSITPTNCEATLDDYHFKAVKILLGMVGFAFYAFIPYFVQFTLMAKIEDEITSKVRSTVFDKLMVLPIKWHEREQNQGGKAASRCSVDAKQVGGLLTNYIPILVSNFCTIGAGIIIALCYNWKLGLLSLFASPLIAIAAYISMIFIGGYDDESLHKYQDSDQMADELIMSMRTILSFNYQSRLIKKYQAKLTEPVQDTLKLGAKIGLTFGSSIMVFTISVASLLYAAANILANSGHIQSIEFVIVFTVPVWCGWVAGNNFFYASHVSAGKLSAKSIFRLLDLKSESELQKATKPMPSNIKGKIEFRNVSFSYGKGNRDVLSNVSLVIQSGEKAAFVGASGCGKTTAMQLLQRFYDYEGEILLDDVNIQEYDLKEYRKLFGVVSQQPNLFMGTLRQNVASANQQAYQDQQIAQICRLALAYDLKQSANQSDEKILEFLQKEVGPKGSKISGGEKQRVALARALLRKPQIFLMDQGTSALDRETERNVQDNLDSALRGRTSISIAHRIETIENSDVIFLFEHGHVIQQGLYVQLMKKKSSFKKFVSGKE